MGLNHYGFGFGISYYLVSASINFWSGTFWAKSAIALNSFGLTCLDKLTGTTHKLSDISYLDKFNNEIIIKFSSQDNTCDVLIRVSNSLPESSPISLQDFFSLHPELFLNNSNSLINTTIISSENLSTTIQTLERFSNSLG